MAATAAADRLESLAEDVTGRADVVAEEIREAISQRDGLKRVGGWRDDHAAKLLANVLDQVRELLGWLERVEDQLETEINDPFEEAV